MELLFVQAVVAGVLTGAVYATISSGLGLVLAIGRIANIAHGELVIAGGYVAWVLVAGLGWHPVAALPLAAVAGGLLCLGIHPMVARLPPPRATNALALTFGLALVGQSALHGLFGADYRLLAPELMWGSTVVGGVSLHQGRLAAAAVAVGLLLGFHWVLMSTHLGRCLRAASMDPIGAALVGLSVVRIERAAFLLGGGLAGASGVLYALLFVISPAAGVAPTLVALTLAVWAGFGKPAGLLVGGFVLGVVEALAVAFGGWAWRDLIVSLVLLGVLLARGLREAEGGQHG
ncbi:MAG TPA: branched-chain amino acid ABC transporter permease [Chloroflexota bacterium]